MKDKELTIEEIKKMNIYEKMSLITNEIGVVEKGLNVSMGRGTSYKAVSERDVLDAVKPIEKKYRVYSYPEETEIINNEVLEKQNQYGTSHSFFLRLKRVYRFINIDNPSEYVDVTSYGDGIDTGDKATGKAMTYADKYALMKAYKLSTGDDPDKEASPQEGYNHYSNKTQNKATSEPNTQTVGNITDTQIKAIQTLYTAEEIQAMLHRKGYKDIHELTSNEATQIIIFRKK